MHLIEIGLARLFDTKVLSIFWVVDLLARNFTQVEEFSLLALDL